MKTKNILLTGLIMASIVGTSHAGLIVTASAEGQLTSLESNITTVDFSNGTAGYASVMGDFELNQGSQPTGTDSSWGSVTIDGTATFDLGHTSDYFGLFWGSNDRAYNSISFILDGTSVGSYTGQEIADMFSSFTGNLANNYFNFAFTDGQLFDTVKLSTSNANRYFESDNHSFRNVEVSEVSEPSSLALLTLSIFGLVASRRRKAA